MEDQVPTNKIEVRKKNLKIGKKLFTLDGANNMNDKSDSEEMEEEEKKGGGPRRGRSDRRRCGITKK